MNESEPEDSRRSSCPPAPGGSVKVFELTLIALALLFGASPALAQDEFPKLTWNGLLDARGIETGTTESWLDGGLGKTRYGGIDGQSATLFRLSGASLVLGAEAS